MSQILRATIYGAAWLFVVAALRFVSEAEEWWLRWNITLVPCPPGVPANQWVAAQLGAMYRHTVWERLMAHQAALGMVIGLWLACWWWWALQRGFRIAQPLAVWLSMIIPGALIAMTVLSTLSPNGFGNFVDSVFQWRHFPW